MQSRTVIASLTSTALLTAGLVGVATVAAPAASASVCGHSQEMRTYSSVLSLSLLNQSLDPFGGKKAVSVYGHCGNTKVKIQVEAATGNYTVCVPPGDSWLGFVNEGRKVKYAYYIGSC